jgi:acyl carrier protein
MRDFKVKDRHEEETILDDLITILEEMSSGWEMQFEGSIGPHTLLGEDLALKSIDLVRLVASIQKHYDRQDLPFQGLLIPDDRPVEDLRVSDLVGFLHKHLNRP